MSINYGLLLLGSLMRGGTLLLIRKQLKMENENAEADDVYALTDMADETFVL